MYITARVMNISKTNEEEIRILFNKNWKFKKMYSNVNRAVTISSPNNHSY